MNNTDRIFYFLFFIMCMCSVFVHSNQFVDTYILPKWYSSLVVFFIGFIYVLLNIMLSNSIHISTSILVRIVIIVSLIQAVLGILQYSGFIFSPSIYRVSGSFDNPAGFATCLCSGFPFIRIILLKDNKVYFKYLEGIIAFIIIVAIVFSEVRAGIIAMVIVCYLYILRVFKYGAIINVIILFIVLFLFIALYFYKLDSANGRLLIWKCSSFMILESPYIGHGYGYFEANYMDYQAKYLNEIGDDKFLMLAGNVKHPFNEYIKIVVNYGFLGLFGVLILIIQLIIFYIRKNNAVDYSPIYLLISIGLLAFFSYPLNYPFTWIVLILSISILIKKIVIFASVNKMKKYCFVGLIIVLFTCCKLISIIRLEIEWNEAFYLSKCGCNEKSLSEYRKIEDRLNDNPYFLYNYAAILFENKLYSNCLEIALQCRRYSADYDLDLMIGKVYHQMGDLQSSEKYYFSSKKMCPSRFEPLYLLFKLYKEFDKPESAFQIATSIINKPMKIKTTEILLIKSEMRNYLSKTKSKYEY